MSKKLSGWQPSPVFPGALTYVPPGIETEAPPVQASAPYQYAETTSVGPQVVRTPTCYNQAYNGNGGNNVFVSDVGGDFIFTHYSFSYCTAGTLVTDFVYARLDVKRGGTVIWAVDIILKNGTGGVYADNLEGNPGIVLQKGDSFEVYIAQGAATTYQAIASVTLQPYK